MPKNRYYFLLYVGFVWSMLPICNPFIFGQSITSDSSKQFFWLNGGIGVSSVHGGLGSYPGASSFGGSFCYQSDNSLHSFRYIRNEEFQLLGSDLPTETVWDCGALYGRIAKASYGFASISCGISILGGVRRGRYLSSSGNWFFATRYYDENNFITIGIPVEGQLFWMPSSFFGIGLYGFANLNNEKSFAGALLCIQLGKLR